LTYLREREPAIFNALVFSAVHCARQAITTGEGDFRIVRPRKADTFVAAPMNVHVLSAYQKLIGKVGMARRRAILDARAQGVLDEARGVFDAEILRLRPLAKDQIARWLRAEYTLAGVLHRLLGYLSARNPARSS